VESESAVVKMIWKLWIAAMILMDFFFMVREGVEEVDTDVLSYIEHRSIN
jgi:hypothetical protein